MYSKVQYISQGSTANEQLNNIKMVLDADYKWIQLRFKNQSDEVLMPLAEKVKKLCDVYDATFIVNDHIEIAKSIDASGVHLGLTDSSVMNARTVLGNEKIIGGTANTLADVLQRIDEGCNYIGLGPFRFTKTKEKLSPVLGLEGYESILKSLNEVGKSIPLYAIGGIELHDVQTLMQTGLYGIAVSGLLTNNTIAFKELQQEVEANITLK